MGLRHLFWRGADAAKSENTLGHSFGFTGSQLSKIDVRWCIHDSFPAAACQRIAQRLRDEGFRVDKVSHTKPWGAGFHIELSDFEVFYMIAAEPGDAAVIEYTTSSWCSRPFWKHPNSEHVTNVWNQVIQKIERILREDSHIMSLRRRSEH